MPYADPEKKRLNDLANTRRYRERATAAKISKREALLASRPAWPDVDLAWAAGMFEGEGTVTISTVTRGERTYGRSVVSLTSTDPEIVVFFHDRWPGYLSTRQGKPHQKVATTWRLQNNGVIAFLEDIEPYLRTAAEREKVALVLESQRARWAGYRLGGHAERMQGYAERIRHLNLRGVSPG